MKAVESTLTILALTISMAACGSSSSNNNTCTSLPPAPKGALSSLKVGYSQIGAEGSNPFRSTETSSMQNQAGALGVTLHVFDAGGNANQQVSDVQSMINGKYDVIFLSPVDETSLNPQIVQAREACIPVFLLDRDVNHAQAVPGKDYVAFMGSDFVQEGNRIANWLVTHWDATANGNIVVYELLGTPGASPAIGRDQGFRSAITELAATNPNAAALTYYSADPNGVNGNFVRSTASGLIGTSNANNIFTQGSPAPNFIYAENDEMGLGALDAITNFYGNPNNTIPPMQSQFTNATIKPGQNVWISSMDGEAETMGDIKNGVYNVLVTCSPAFGPLAFQTLQSYLSGATVPPWVVVSDTLVDSSNVQDPNVSALGF